MQDAPALKQDDIDMFVQDNKLVISAFRKSESRRSDANHFCHRERPANVHLMSIIPLPSAVDQERVNAELANGVLKFRFAKRSKSNKTKIALGSSKYPFAK